MGRLVDHFDTNNSANQSPDGVYLATGLITALLIRAIMYSCCYLMYAHLAMKIRVATCNLIYNKVGITIVKNVKMKPFLIVGLLLSLFCFFFSQALRLKINSLDQSSTGKIVNLMSNDVSRFDISIAYAPFLWIGPLETIIITYFLWQEVGVSSILGVGTLLVFVPLQGRYTLCLIQYHYRKSFFLYYTFYE